MFCVTASKAIVITTVEVRLNVLNRSLNTTTSHFISYTVACLHKELIIQSHGSKYILVCGRDRDDSLKFKTCIRFGKKGNFKLKFEGGRWSQTGCCSIFTSQPPLGFTENIPKERKLSRERQVCGGKRLGDVSGQRSKCADWSAVMERQQEVK